MGSEYGEHLETQNYYLCLWYCFLLVSEKKITSETKHLIMLLIIYVSHLVLIGQVAAAECRLALSSRR